MIGFDHLIELDEIQIFPNVILFAQMPKIPKLFVRSGVIFEFTNVCFMAFLYHLLLYYISKLQVRKVTYQYFSLEEYDLATSFLLRFVACMSVAAINANCTITILYYCQPEYCMSSVSILLLFQRLVQPFSLLYTIQFASDTLRTIVVSFEA